MAAIAYYLRGTFEASEISDGTVTLLDHVQPGPALSDFSAAPLCESRMIRATVIDRRYNFLSGKRIESRSGYRRIETAV